MQKFDHIIIGTGQATGILLGHLISKGERIAVIEGAKVGGSCVNYGCTPTKTLVASARAIYQAGRGKEMGFDSGPVTVDYSRVRNRMNEIRNASNMGLTDWMESTDNVTLFREWGSFRDQKTLEVGEDLMQGKQIYINTGTRPSAPPIDGLEDVPWMDSAGLLDLEALPSHLLIVGGGYIGLEFAQIYRRFGSEVTVVQRGSQVMPKEDKDVAEAIREFLEEEGVNIRCNTSAKSVSKHGEQIFLEVEKDGKSTPLKGSHLLIAAGRKPNVEKLRPEKAGIKLQNGFIRVDDHCQTSVRDVFALGDVNGHGAFTHTSVNDAGIVVDYLSGGGRTLSGRLPIYALFTDPPLGRVGFSEKEALNKGMNLLKATKPMSEISRAKEMGETRGLAKLLVDADTDLIVGAAILGPGGDEIINMFGAIMHGQITCRNYREAMLVHPTVSELMPFVLDGLEKVDG